MLGVLAALLDETLLRPDFVALDLCCGPGAITRRLLDRFPEARTVGVDFDPVTLAIAQGAIGSANERARWVDADVTQANWLEATGEQEFDVVLSTTALHWLTPGDLAALYRRLGRVIPVGGAFLNGDNMDFDPHMPTFARIAKRIDDGEQTRAWASGVEDWTVWWDAVELEPFFASLVRERHRRFPPSEAPHETASFSFHVAALRDAGFREVGAIWQGISPDNRVILAIR
ncbi:MAG: class I SAM-dependent methyltransferase [Pleurocapsa sp. SU_196_0]|nr:class I SAM-dependent methyltransferase [Pleurocapsa sp. SU_196_0]